VSWGNKILTVVGHLQGHCVKSQLTERGELVDIKGLLRQSCAKTIDKG